MPRPEEVYVVDPLELMGEDQAPALDPGTGLPAKIQAYVVSKDPHMTVIPHFFSPAECEHLIGLVDGCWNPSLVGQATYSSEEEYSKGDLENTLSKTRTSWSCMLRYAQTSIVERLEHRLAHVSGLPLEQLERLNMVRYAPGELFNEHHDGKFRPRTVFVYLNDLPEDDLAGDTFFPVLGLSFRPRRGTAVIWSNILPGSEEEDSRMLHMGRAPNRGVKYGVNCFFNVKCMRTMMELGPDVAPEEAALVDVRQLVPKGASNDDSEIRPGGNFDLSKLTAYCLMKEPRITAVPQLILPDEVDHILELTRTSGVGRKQASHFGSDLLGLLQAGQTPMLESVEIRLAAVGGLSLSHMARLRVVQPSREAGLCNRGCGPKSLFVCLSDVDDVLFPSLGLMLRLRRGDAITWPNIDWETGKAVEDIRTIRRHLGDTAGGSHAVGLEVHFHDNPVREQQQLRRFATDEDIAAGDFSAEALHVDDSTRGQ